MWEKCKQAADNIQVFGTLLTDLSKASDEFLTAKSNIYRFSLKAFKLINNYLSQENQRTKIVNLTVDGKQILFGVPQG